MGLFKGTDYVDFYLLQILLLKILSKINAMLIQIATRKIRCPELVFRVFEPVNEHLDKF